MQNLENSMLVYLTQISKINLLSREEEYDLAKRARAGEKEAKNRLIRANLRFVVQTAKRYSNCGLPFIDLISEGNLGLIRAVDSFDPDKGFHFISYAVYWIKQSIIKAISEKSKLVRLPLNLNNNLSTIESSIREFHRDELSDEMLESLADKIKMKKKDVINLIEVTRNHTSLDATVGSSQKNSNELKDLLRDEKANDPESLAVTGSLKGEMEDVLTSLSSLEAEVIRLRYGLGGDQPKTLLEIGKRRGLTKERIRQIEKKALEKLKESASEKDLQVYVA